MPDIRSETHCASMCDKPTLLRSIGHTVMSVIVVDKTASVTSIILRNKKYLSMSINISYRNAIADQSAESQTVSMMISAICTPSRSSFGKWTSVAIPAAIETIAAMAAMTARAVTFRPRSAHQVMLSLPETCSAVFQPQLHLHVALVSLTGDTVLVRSD